jgi:uncharacterized protein (DUF58 family)
LFGSGMLGTLVVLLVVSVIAREGSLFLLALALLVAAGLSRLWERHCLTGVEYRRSLSRHQVPYGEAIQLEVEIANRKLLPLSWLEVEDEIPRELLPDRGRTYGSHKPGRSLLANLVALRPYEWVRRRYTIHCLARGEYSFGPVRLRSGDLFGFASAERTVELADSVVVFPRVVPLPELGLPARQPLGDLRAQSWIFEDPSRIAGAREYRPGDSLRRIHWPASARTQRLQSAVYEATTSHKLMIFLNVSTTEMAWSYGYDPDILELGITTAASIADWGLQRGYQVGLFANGFHWRRQGEVMVDVGCDADQLKRILLCLGRLQPISRGSFEDLLARHSGRLAYGATVVAVTSAVFPPAGSALRLLRARGHAVTVVLTGRLGVGASLPWVAVRRVGPPEAWKQTPELSLVRAPGVVG